MDFSVGALGSWDTCHHPDKGEILTTTQPYKKYGSNNALNKYKLVMMLVVNSATSIIKLAINLYKWSYDGKHVQVFENQR